MSKFNRWWYLTKVKDIQKSVNKHDDHNTQSKLDSDTGKRLRGDQRGARKARCSTWTGDPSPVRAKQVEKRQGKLEADLDTL